MNREELKKRIDGQEDYVIGMRREFHRYPEVSGQEFHTREVLVRELESMKVPYRLLKGTGILAWIEGGRPGKGKAIRADIDGLPLPEDPENLKRAKNCVSCVDGVIHACGHDAHMAMLLGTMRVLLSIREEIAGTIYCCFEEGEETNCGVETMLEAMAEYSIEECFALHVYHALEAGKVNVAAGPRMAGALTFEFQIQGKAGHGSRPDQAVNPIVPAAHIVTQLNSAFVNQLNVEETVTLSVCSLLTGEKTLNIIPAEVYVGGTARFFNKEEGEKAMEIINRVAEHTAACHKCTAAFTPMNRIRLHPIINDAGLTERIRGNVTKLYGEEVLSNCGCWYASDCYCKYLDRYAGAMGFLGIRNENYGSGAAHHNGKFDLDESALKLGVGVEVAFALGE